MSWIDPVRYSPHHLKWMVEVWRWHWKKWKSDVILWELLIFAMLGLQMCIFCCLGWSSVEFTLSRGPWLSSPAQLCLLRQFANPVCIHALDVFYPSTPWQRELANAQWWNMLSSSWAARRSILGGWSQLDMNSVSQPKLLFSYLFCYLLSHQGIFFLQSDQIQYIHKF